MCACMQISKELLFSFYSILSISLFSSLPLISNPSLHFSPFPPPCPVSFHFLPYPPPNSFPLFSLPVISSLFRFLCPPSCLFSSRLHSFSIIYAALFLFSDTFTVSFPCSFMSCPPLLFCPPFCPLLIVLFDFLSLCLNTFLFYFHLFIFSLSFFAWSPPRSLSPHLRVLIRFLPSLVFSSTFSSVLSVSSPWGIYFVFFSHHSSFSPSLLSSLFFFPSPALSSSLVPSCCPLFSSLSSPCWYLIPSPPQSPSDRVRPPPLAPSPFFPIRFFSSSPCHASFIPAFGVLSSSFPDISSFTRLLYLSLCHLSDPRLPSFVRVLHRLLFSSSLFPRFFFFFFSVLFFSLSS